MAEGEAEAAGEADSEAAGEGDAAGFFLLNLEAGEAVTEEVLVFLPVFVLVFPGRVGVVDVVVIDSSFFWDWQPMNAAIVSAVIRDKTGVFIRLVKLNER